MEKKLKAWQQAGLIDRDVADRILAWEAEHRRPTGLWALIGLAVMTIGLGLVSLVAANWDAIPAMLRLAVHMLILLGVAAALLLYLSRPATSARVSDAGLFLFALLGLTFLAHVGQAYQTSAPLWQPLLVWLLLFSPSLLLYGRGPLVAWLWVVGVVGTAWAHADHYGDLHLWRPGAAALLSDAVYWGLIASPPMLIVACAAWVRGHSIRPGFWRQLEALALAAILFAFSLFILVTGFGGPAHIPFISVAIHCTALVGAAVAVCRAQSGRSGRATGAILVAIAILHFIGMLLPWGQSSAWVSSLFFLALWGAVAASAVDAGWRGLSQTAITLIALRIILLSFELGDDLLGSGAGLIMAGLIALAVAWMAIRLSRRFAPARQGVT